MRQDNSRLVPGRTSACSNARRVEGSAEGRIDRKARSCATRPCWRPKPGWKAYANELTDADRDFLDESRKARLQAEARAPGTSARELAEKTGKAGAEPRGGARASARRLRRILAVTLVALAAVVVLGVLAFNYRNRSLSQTGCRRILLNRSQHIRLGLFWLTSSP